MEIPRPGLLDLLECAHEGAQGAIVPALLVVGALLKWQIKISFFLHALPISMIWPKTERLCAAEDSTLSTMDSALVLSTQIVVSKILNKNRGRKCQLKVMILSFCKQSSVKSILSSHFQRYFKNLQLKRLLERLLFWSLHRCIVKVCYEVLETFWKIKEMIED